MNKTPKRYNRKKNYSLHWLVEHYYQWKLLKPKHPDMLKSFTNHITIITVMSGCERNIPGPGTSSSPGTPPDHRLVVETKAELDM